MKRLITFFLLGLSLAAANADTRMMVFSDPHVFAPTLFDTTSASFKAYYQSEPKLVEHSAELFDSAVARVIAAHPDILLIPGDMTKDGEQASHAYVTSALAQIETAGTKVYVVPGNHDIENPSSKSYLGATAAPVANIDSATYRTMYANYGYGEAVLTNGLNYMVYPTSDLAIIGINSCKTNNGTRYSAGGINETTMQWIEQAAAQAVATGRTVVGMMHHEVMMHFDNQADIAPTYVANQEEEYPDLGSIQQRLIDAGIRVMFTGHYHITSIQKVASSTDADTWLYDISTGSTCSYASAVRTLTYDNGTLSISTSEITKYHALEQERNGNTARGGINALANKFFPYMQSFQAMMEDFFMGNKYRFPANASALATDISTYMLPSFQQVINELSRGDEDLRADADSTLYKACIAGFDNYINYFCYNIAKRRSFLEDFFAGDADMPGQVKQITKSILYNFVSIEETDSTFLEQKVADGTLSMMLSMAHPTSLEEMNGRSYKAKGVYTLSGLLIAGDQAALESLPRGCYIVDGELRIRF